MRGKVHAAGPSAGPSAAVVATGGGAPRRCARYRDEVGERRRPLGSAGDPARRPSIVDDVLRSPGQPLDAVTRAYFEPRFGHDFGRVRVHADAWAAASARAENALAYTVGSHIVLDPARTPPPHRGGLWTLAHELAHVVQQSAATPVSRPVGVDRDDRREADADRAAWAVVACGTVPTRPALRLAALAIQRLRFGDDGRMGVRHQEVVRQAAAITERLVTDAGGTPTFRRRWEAFWAGPGTRITPRPTLEQYRAAVRGRIVHDMDTSRRADVRDLVQSERAMPLERQTAAVTVVGTVDTYIRRFAIEQGVDTVVSLLLHESLHGAGLPMGPFEMFEPLFHVFEAEVGFPMMMGGSEILEIRQLRRGDTDVDVSIVFRLYRVEPHEPLPPSLEIQIVGAMSGEVVFDERAGGGREPARHPIPSRVGRGTWVWHARNPGFGVYSVRIVSTAERTLLASRHFETDPRCVIGVSTMHCEDAAEARP